MAQAVGIKEYRTRVLGQLFSRIVQEKSASGVRWLRAVLDKNRGLLETLEGPRDDFDARLGEALQDSELLDDLRADLAAIADHAGVKRPEEDPEAEEAEDADEQTEPDEGT